MTASPQDHFQNDNITVTIKREPGCRIHLDVVANPTAVKAGRNKALKVINKEVSIPGFRKGKAPGAVVEERFATYIDKEWKDIVLQTAFEEAIRLINIFPFTKSSVHAATVKSISLENGATLTYDYEEAPRVPETPSDRLTQLSIPSISKREVSQEDIGNVIDDLRLRHAEWTIIADRPIQEGDFIDLDVAHSPHVVDIHLSEGVQKLLAIQRIFLHMLFQILPLLLTHVFNRAEMRVGSGVIDITLTF